MVKQFFIIWFFHLVGAVVDITHGLFVLLTIGFYTGDWSREYWSWVIEYYNRNFPEMVEEVKRRQGE